MDRILLSSPSKIRNPMSPSSNSIRNSRNCSPKFETVSTLSTTPTTNHFRPVHRRWNPRVPPRSSRRELRPGAFNFSIRLTVRLQSANLCLAPTNFVFSGEPPPLLHRGFLHFSVFPFLQCWRLVLKCYELRTKQHKMLNVNVLRP
jgi:hypothetical protein